MQLAGNVVEVGAARLEVLAAGPGVQLPLHLLVVELRLPSSDQQHISTLEAADIL